MSKKVNNNAAVYTIFFMHPASKNIVLLAYTADIESICYSDVPSLPGTCNYRLAKKYSTIEQARSDIYRLRYHHRDFLKVFIGIKELSENELDIGALSADVSHYLLPELLYKN